MERDYDQVSRIWKPVSLLVNRDLKIPGREILGRGITAEESLGRVHRRKAPKLNLRNARTRSRTDQCRIIVYNFLTT